MVLYMFSLSHQGLRLCFVPFVSVKHTHELEHENGSEWVNLAQCLTTTDTKPTSEWNSMCIN